MQTDVGELAPKVRCPTLVLHSRHDSIVPFDEARTLAAIIPRAQFVPLESRNHVLLNTESVWQQFVDALETFLPAPLPVVTTLIDDLTSREREVLEFIAQGLDNSRISTRLKISEKTVRNHVSTIFSKLGVNSRAHTVVVARDAGFGRRTIKP